MVTVEVLYGITTIGMALAGLFLVGMALRAYIATGQRAMVHLSIGFALVVAAAVATAISAFLTDFEHVRSLLVVNGGLNTLGYTFVVYSLIGYGG